MHFKHSMSIFSTHLTLLYKVLLFIFVVFIIASAIFVSIFNPLVQGVKEALVLEGYKFSVREILDKPVESLTQIRKTVSDFLSAHPNLILSRVMFLILLIVFTRFFISLSYVPVTKVIYDKMTAGYSGGLFSRLVDSLLQTMGYAFFSSLINTALDIGIFTLSLYVFSLFYKVISVAALPIGVTLALTLYSLRISLFSQWLPLICDGNKNIFKALVLNFKKAAKCLKYHFPMTLTVTILYLGVLTTTAISTFGLLPIMAFPMYIILICIFNLVSYFNLNNRKYYTDNGVSVYTPKEQ